MSKWLEMYQTGEWREWVKELEASQPRPLPGSVLMAADEEWFIVETQGGLAWIRQNLYR